MPGRPKTRARKLTALEYCTSELASTILDIVPPDWSDAWWLERRFLTKGEDERDLRKACDAAIELSQALGRIAAAARGKAGFPDAPIDGQDEDVITEILRLVGIRCPRTEIAALALYGPCAPIPRDDR